MHCNAVASSQPVSIHMNRFVGNLHVLTERALAHSDHLTHCMSTATWLRNTNALYLRWERAPG